MGSLTRLLRKWTRTVRPTVPTPLVFEELEARWNPSTTSTNWSGYAVDSTAGSVSSVSGTWTVPTVTGTGSGTTYSSVWVGIDGYSSSTVEQTGIEADVTNGVAHYSAWYEMYPSAPVTFSGVTVHPGDTISASVSYSASTGKFTLSLEDVTSSTSASTSQSAPGAQRSSAEWIVEAPSSNTGVLPLANFGTVTISNATATINGTTGAISAWSNEAINMVSSSGKVEDTTSALTSNGGGFTVTYGSAVSPPPVSPPPPAVATSPPAPVSPPPAPVSPPPAPASVATTTTLSVTSTGETRSGEPTVTLTVTVSPSVPTGSLVALLSGTTVLGYGRVSKVGGVDEVSFTVEFPQAGTYSFTAEYLGSGADAPSTSNVVTVTVPAAQTQRNPLTGSWLPPNPFGGWYGW